MNSPTDLSRLGKFFMVVKGWWKFYYSPRLKRPRAGVDCARQIKGCHLLVGLTLQIGPTTAHPNIYVFAKHLSRVQADANIPLNSHDQKISPDRNL